MPALTLADLAGAGDLAAIQAGFDDQAVAGYSANPQQLPSTPSSISASDAITALASIGRAAADLGAGVLQFKQQAASIEMARDTLAANRATNSAQLDMQRLQAGTAVDLAKISGATALARAQQVLNAENLRTQEAANGGTFLLGGQSYDKWMIALALAGLVVAYMQLRKRK